MTATATPVNTSKVHRRPLKFWSTDDLRQELAQIEAAHRAGRLKARGNWKPGQVLGHLATWAEFTYSGNPLRPPWFIRWVLKRRKGRYLNEGMPAGVRIPRVPGGTLGTDDLPFDQAIVRYRTIVDRLDREAPTLPNVIFGPLSHEEWKQLQLRHAELHLGFLDPG